MTEKTGKSVKFAETSVLLPDTGSPRTNEATSKTEGSKFSGLKKPYLVELPIFLFFLAYRAALPLKEQLVYALMSERYAGVPLEETTGPSSVLCQVIRDPELNVTIFDIQAEALVQQESSLLLSFMNIVRNTPALVTTLIICSYTDVVGRRIGLIVPAIGGIIKCVIYIILVLSDTDDFEWLLYFGEFFDGLGGSIMTAQSSAVAYISDTVSTREKSLRFTIIQAAQFVGAGIGNLGIGYLIQSGFSQALWVVFGIYAACVLYVFILLPESLQSNAKKETNVFATLKNAVTVFRLYSDKIRPSLDRIILLLMLVTVVAENLGLLGRNDVDILYAIGIPFCLTPVLIGYFQVARYGCKALAATVGVKVMGFYFSDAIIGAVGSFFGILGNGLMGLAANTAQLWGVPALTGPCGVVLPVAQAIMSNTVSADEQGMLFASLGVVTGASDMVSGFVMNIIYAETVDYFSGAVFLVVSGLYVISGINFICVLLVGNHKKKIETEGEHISMDTQGPVENRVREKDLLGSLEN